MLVTTVFLKHIRTPTYAILCIYFLCVILASMTAVNFAGAAGLIQTKLWERDPKISHLLLEEF